MTVLSSKYHINIVRDVYAPGNGKGLLYGLNATDKQYLASYLCTISNLEDEVYQDLMNGHLVENSDKV